MLRPDFDDPAGCRDDGFFAAFVPALPFAALFDEAECVLLCCFFSAGLLDFLADFSAGLEALFFAGLVDFFTLFLLAIAYST